MPAAKLNTQIRPKLCRITDRAKLTLVIVSCLIAARLQAGEAFLGTMTPEALVTALERLLTELDCARELFLGHILQLLEPAGETAVILLCLEVWLICSLSLFLFFLFSVFLSDRNRGDCRPV